MMQQLTKASGTMYYAMTNAIVHGAAKKFASCTVTLANGQTVDQSWYLHHKWIYRLDYTREKGEELCYGTNDVEVVERARKEISRKS